MDIFWNVTSDGLIADKTEEYLTFSDETGSFFLFIVGVYEFDNTDKKLKLTDEIKRQIGDESETIPMIDAEELFVGLINNNNAGEDLFGMLGFKIGAHSIVKFAVSFEEYETKEKVLPIIVSLEEEIEP